MATRRRAGRVLWLALLLALLAGGAAADEPEAPDEGGYGGTPEALRPYREGGEPARRFFVDPPTFRGPGADEPDAVVDVVRIGVLAPLGGKDEAVGRRLRQGLALALDEANADGGYREGVPFALLERNEDDVWGAAGNAVVDLVTRYGVWAVVGALEDSNSHVMTRVLLKVELPMVNTGGPDPTLTEHNIPWLVRMRPDDRQTSYRLAKKIFEEDGRRRVAVFRSNDRYGRTGTGELVDAARRLHHPIALEVRFPDLESDLAPQVGRVRAARPDAVVIWGRAGPAGRALRALRAAGVDVPVYGPDRLLDPAFLEAAGPAAEGVVIAYPFDLDGEAPAWTAFRARYEARFGEAPEAYAAYAYDGLRYLIASIREGGLNRPRIRNALYAHDHFDGVMGPIRFDTTHNNVVPAVLAHVEGGSWHFDG